MLFLTFFLFFFGCLFFGARVCFLGEEEVEEEEEEEG